MSAGTPAWLPPAAGSITAGTTNLLSKYTDGINSVLGASGISDNGTKVTTSENLAPTVVDAARYYATAQAGADNSAKIPPNRDRGYLRTG